MTSPTKLVRLRLEEGIGDVVVEAPQRDALVIVLAGGRPVGQVLLRGARRHTAEEVGARVQAEIGERLARTAVRAQVREALGGGANGRAPQVSVVVCTRGRPQLLARCLDSLAALRSPAAEVIVVDNEPADRRTEAVCAGRPVRRLPGAGEPLSALRTRGAAAARSELVAYVDDDCVVEPDWLDGLGEPFADPLCAAVVGYVGPVELVHAAQWRFEAHGGFEMSFEPRVVDGAYGSPALDAAPLGVGNAIIRRAALERAGGFDERLGPGAPGRAKEDAALFVRLLLAGERVVFDPARVVWHRHRATRRELRRVLHAYAAGDAAYAALCLVEHRQLDALQLWRWWWQTHLPADVRKLWRRQDGAIPLDCVLAEALGTLEGPAAFALARRRGGPAGRPAAGVHAAPAARVVRDPAPVSVVVPSHDRRAELLAVLDGLARQTARAAMEVVVVLDGCRDGSAEAVRAVGWPFTLKVVDQAAAGVAAARNRGAREAAHDLLVMLDDDLVPGPELVAEHAAAAGGERSVTMGRHPPPAGGADPLAALLRAWWEDHFRRKGQPGRPWSFLDFCSGNSALSRSQLLEAGGFDERFTARGEDYELAIRLLERGATFRYVPSALGEHRIATDLPTALAKARAEGRNDVRIARRHPHVFGRLRLSRLVTREIHVRALRLALAAPGVAEAALRARTHTVVQLGRLGLRRRWLAAFGEAHGLAFALGVREETGSAEALRALVLSAAAAAGDRPAVLDLDAPARLGPLPSAGTASLVVCRRRAPVARVRAVDGGEQWDADVVAERVAAAVAGA